ncbi:hypothetical protein PENTCL1PPCAC_20689, partial [Pristionchus entomophagus]
QNVNLDIGPSAHSDGLDLPFNDITTLRFFFNLGVQQSRVVLLSLHFVQVYYEKSQQQLQQQPIANAAAAPTLSALQQHQHILEQQRKSVFAAAANAANDALRQRNQQAILSTTGSDAPARHHVPGTTHSTNRAGATGSAAATNATHEQAVQLVTTQQTSVSVAAAAGSSSTDDATYPAANSSAAEETTEDSASSTATLKQKAPITSSIQKSLKVTSLNDLVLKLASTKVDRQRRKKKQNVPSRSDPMDAAPASSTSRSAFAIRSDPASLRLEHALSMHLPPDVSSSRSAAADDQISSHKLISATAKPPAVNDFRVTEKDDTRDGPALAPMLMVSYFNSHFGKTTKPLQRRGVHNPSVQSKLIPLSYDNQNPQHQQQKSTSCPSAIESATADAAIESLQQLTHMAIRRPVKQTSWSIHNILNDTASTSKNGTTSPIHLSAPGVPHGVHDIQDVVEPDDNDVAHRELATTSSALSQILVDQSAAKFAANKSDDNELMAPTSTVVRESSTRSTVTYANRVSFSEHMSAPGTSSGDLYRLDDYEPDEVEEPPRQLAKAASSLIEVRDSQSASEDTTKTTNASEVATATVPEESLSESSDSCASETSFPKHLSAPRMPAGLHNRLDNEEPSEYDEVLRLSGTTSPTLIQVITAQSDQSAAECATSNSDNSEALRTSTVLGASSSGSADACANGSSCHLSAHSTLSDVQDRKDDGEPAIRNDRNPTNSICPTFDLKNITEMMSLFNNRVSAMAEEIRSLKEQLIINKY